MNCDDFLPYLETGSIWQRIQAHWHARGCIRCAKAKRALKKFKVEELQHLLISPYQERLWEQPATENVIQPRSATPVVWLAFTAAMLVVVAAATMVVYSNRLAPRSAPIGPQEVAQTKSAPEVVVRKSDPTTELAGLQEKLAALEIEITQVSKQVELADARQQVDELIQTYSQW